MEWIKLIQQEIIVSDIMKTLHFKYILKFKFYIHLHNIIYPNMINPTWELTYKILSNLNSFLTSPYNFICVDYKSA